MPSIIRALLQTLLQLSFVWLAFLVSLNIFLFGLSHDYRSMYSFQPIHGRVEGPAVWAGTPRLPSPGTGPPGSPMVFAVPHPTAVVELPTVDSIAFWSRILTSDVVGTFFCSSWSFFQCPLMSQAANSFWGKNLLFLHIITLVVSHQTISWNLT